MEETMVKSTWLAFKLNKRGPPQPMLIKREFGLKRDLSRISKTWQTLKPSTHSVKQKYQQF
jgi:hypothetical protein